MRQGPTKRYENPAVTKKSTSTTVQNSTNLENTTFANVFVSFFKNVDDDIALYNTISFFSRMQHTKKLTEGEVYFIYSSLSSKDILKLFHIIILNNAFEYKDIIESLIDFAYWKDDESTLHKLISDIEKHYKECFVLGNDDVIKAIMKSFFENFVYTFIDNNYGYDSSYRDHFFNAVINIANSFNSNNQLLFLIMKSDVENFCEAYIRKYTNYSDKAEYTIDFNSKHISEQTLLEALLYIGEKRRNNFNLSDDVKILVDAVEKRKNVEEVFNKEPIFNKEQIFSKYEKFLSKWSI